MRQVGRDRFPTVVVSVVKRGIWDPFFPASRTWVYCATVDGTEIKAVVTRHASEGKAVRAIALKFKRRFDVRLCTFDRILPGLWALAFLPSRRTSL